MGNAPSHSKLLNNPGANLRAEPKLEIGKRTLRNDALRDFVSDCIVPALVDRFLRDRLNLQDPVRGEHNEAHL